MADDDLLFDDSNTITVYASNSTKWGIFDSAGKIVVTPDSFIGIDPAGKEFNLPTYPTENGGFQTYNKVEMPFSAVVIMSCGGSASHRQEFIDSVKSISGDTNLYSLIMPDGNFLNLNFGKYTFTRSREKGATMFTVFWTLSEIRNTATASFANTAQPSGTGNANTGAVQASPATSTQQQYVNDTT